MLIKISLPLSLLLLVLFSPMTLSAEQTLTEALNAQIEASNKKIPDEKKKIMESATDELRESEITNKAVALGETLPEGTLLNHESKEVLITSLIKESPAVITFYRGGWCPYCNLQLRHFQKALPEIKSLGGRLIAISPETPDNSLSTTQKNELEFSVLSDKGNSYAEKLGLVFTLPPDLRQVYLDFGINLEKSNNDSDWELPLAATFVTDKNGKIVYRYVDVDYRKRAPIEDVVESLKKLQ